MENSESSLISNLNQITDSIEGVSQVIPPTPDLNAAERRTLRVVCDTLLPSLTVGAGDDPRLFALNARAIGVAKALEQVVIELDPTQQGQLRQLLRALEHPLFIALLIHRPRRFGLLTRAEREQALSAMATSHLGGLRAGFQALKRLATFYFYSLTDKDGVNPTWPALKYEPPEGTPVAPRLLKLTTIGKAVILDADVCIVGSGAGGGVVAAELAAAGKRVIVLEAGGGYQAPDFDQHEFSGMQRLYLNHGMTATHDLGVTILAAATLGGGATVNWQTSLRPPYEIRREFSERSHCRFFIEDSFTRSVDAVMARLNVNDSESVVNVNNAKLRDGCEALGYGWSVIPRNSQNCQPAQCGFCMWGCRHGGKQGTAVTFLPDAQSKGDVRIIAHCRAERLMISAGSVSGIEAVATDPETGRRHTVQVRASIVVVAAGAINTPALLLRSGIELPALGRNLFLHPTALVLGIYDETIKPWCGPPQTILCDHFARLKGNYGFRLETAPVHPGMLALATPWFGARDHRERMQQAAQTSAFIVLTRDRAGGRVRVGRDGRPLIEYRPGRMERALLRRGVQEAVKIHVAAGAKEVLSPHARKHCFQWTQNSSEALKGFCVRLAREGADGNWMTLYSAHQMGTCRIGSDRRTAVCDPGGEVFGVRGLFVADASAFPASSGVNPMITIMALAHHIAQGIKMR